MGRKNNLTLNICQTKELMITRPRWKQSDLPPAAPGIERVESLKMLGVTFQGKLTFQEHVKKVVSKCSQGAYAMRTLRAHGLTGEALWQVAGATILSCAS